MFRKFKALSKAGKIGVVTGAIALFGIIGSAQQTPTVQLENTKSTTDASVLGAQTAKTAQPKAEAAPVITTKTVTETQSIPFTSTSVNTPNLPKGTSKVSVAGVNGVSTLTYKVTYTDGAQTAKDLVSQVTTTAPTTQITSVGTYVAPPPQPAPTSSCDPNYSGACVPIASDVDCAGGSGNGPAYVHGPVSVVGVDIYDLDRDGNGVGCE